MYKRQPILRFSALHVLFSPVRLYFVQQRLCWTNCKIILTVSADRNTHTLVNGRITDHGKGYLEWSSNRTVKETSPRTGRLMLVGLEITRHAEPFIIRQGTDS